MAEPYHRYVFDIENRRFVGEFEEMYRQERAGGYDSWHQDDVGTLARRAALAMVAARSWESVLDVGCGKGAFTALLASGSARVVGVDVSETAVGIAKARHPEIEFRVLSAGGLAKLGERFELVSVVETLSYLENWREILGSLAAVGDWLFVSLYLPPDPIGFVKTFDDLRARFAEVATVEDELLLNGEQLMLLGRVAR